VKAFAMSDGSFDNQHRQRNRHQLHPGLGCRTHPTRTLLKLLIKCSRAYLRESSGTSSVSTPTRKLVTLGSPGYPRSRTTSSSSATADHNSPIAFRSCGITGARVLKTRINVTSVLEHTPPDPAPKRSETNRVGFFDETPWGAMEDYAG
jgi:hypothetical protein